MSCDPSAQDGASRRIDKWLWCARRFRTRTLAARFVSQASVRVTRDGETQRVDRPAFQLREGDEVSFILGEQLVAMVVAGFADRRGTPQAAKGLYAVRAPSPSGNPSLASKRDNAKKGPRGD